MTWTKLPSEFPDDDELLQVPRGARLMHLECLAYSNRHGTDGLIRHERLKRITDEPRPEKAAQLLVDAGIWADDPLGWRIVKHLGDQPSAAEADRVKQLARDRQRRTRKHNAGDHTECAPNRDCRMSRTTSRVTSGVSHDPRTEPNRTEPKRLGTGAGPTCMACRGRGVIDDPDPPHMPIRCPDCQTHDRATDPLISARPTPARSNKR